MSSPDLVAAVSGDGPMNPDHARNQVVARLMLAGVTPEQIEGRDLSELIELIRTTVLWGGRPPLTLAEVAATAGIDLELARRARMLMGLPDPGDEAVCRAEEIDVFRGFAAGVAVFGADPILAFARVIGSAMAQVGEGALSVFARALDDGGGDIDRVHQPDRYALIAYDALEMFRIIPQVLAVTSTLLFDQANERLGANPGQERPGGVGFVDVVRSTETTEDFGISVMSEAVSRFEERAVESAVARGGRVVKFIGDEVMYITPDLVGAVAVAEDLVAHVAGDPTLGAARAGVASGLLLGRDGDWFGLTVNLAARLVERAKSGDVLFAGDGATELAATRPEITVTRSRKRLRGLADKVEVHRIR